MLSFERLEMLAMLDMLEMLTMLEMLDKQMENSKSLFLNQGIRRKGHTIQIQKISLGGWEFVFVFGN